MLIINKEKNVHIGHRQRLKNAVLKHGLAPFSDIQILETLLFFGVPNGDTNPTAHRLLDHFGSLRAVIEADYNELLTIKGVGENTAQLICFVKLLFGYYYKLINHQPDKKLQLSDSKALCSYFETSFIEAKGEQLRVMALDDNLYLLCEAVLVEGSSLKVSVTARQITEFCLKANSNRIVIAHNHPNGAAIPSNADLNTTRELVDLLKRLEIDVMDHIIVGRTGSFSIRESAHAASIWVRNRLWD